MKKLFFNKDINFYIDNVYCKYYLFDIKKPLVICFSPREIENISGLIKDSKSPWGFDFVKEQGLNIISFRSVKGNCWYQSLIFKEYLKELAKEISIFNQRFGYGGSMGGYGVSAYSNILNLQRVLLYTPISTLEKELVPFESRYNKDNIQKWNGLDGAKMTATAYILYDNLFSNDRKHAERYINTIPLIVSGVGHTLPPSIIGINIIKPLFRDFINNTIDKKQFKIDIKKRRTVKRYYDFMLILNKNSILRKKIILEYKNKNIAEEIPKITDNDIDKLKSIAVKLEKTNIEESYTLMKLAEKFRPKGPFIKKKVEEYELKIKDIKIKRLDVPALKSLVKEYDSKLELENKELMIYKNLRSRINDKCDSADILKQVALALEKDGEINSALVLMNKALNLRPGPIIKKKVEEYEEILSKIKS